MKCFIFIIFIFQYAFATPIQVVSTFSILTDIAEQLTSKNIMIHSLSPKGVDPHNYKTTSHDMMKVSQSQLLIYFGFGIDTSAYKMAKQASPKIDTCQVFQHDKNSGLDPHAWQSPTQGIKIVNQIAQCLKKIMPTQDTVIEKNRQIIESELLKLAHYYQKQFEQLPNNSKKIITAHQAFGYLANEFGLQAFSVLGSDSHNEPSAQKIQKIIDLINKEKIKTLFPESPFLPTSLKRITTLTSIQIGPLLLSDSLPKNSQIADNYQEYLKYNLEQIYQTLRKSNP